MNRRWIATLAVAAAALGGCVEREMKITSEPAGALVYVSDREVGRTPLSLPFTWYGDYDVLIRMDGYKTLRANADITPPWYEVPPLDLFSHMAPWTYRDQRYLHYKLEKQEELTDEQLIKQAEEMKLRTGE
jgi:hypothetical protein